MTVSCCSPVSLAAPEWCPRPREDDAVLPVSATPQTWVEYHPWLDAKCLGLDPEMFFPSRGGVIAAATASSVCYRCHLRFECLTFGLDEQFGVWGGASERDRRQIRHTIHRMEQAGFTRGPALDEMVISHWLNSEPMQVCTHCRRTFPAREFRRRGSRGRCRDCIPQ